MNNQIKNELKAELKMSSDADYIHDHQQLLLSAWELMTPDQRQALLEKPQARDILKSVVFSDSPEPPIAPQTVPGSLKLVPTRNTLQRYRHLHHEDLRLHPECRPVRLHNRR